MKFVGWAKSKTFPNEHPRYDTIQSNSKVPVVLELWEMRSIHLLLSLPGPLWLGVGAPDKILSIGQIN